MAGLASLAILLTPLTSRHCGPSVLGMSLWLELLDTRNRELPALQISASTLSGNYFGHLLPFTLTILYGGGTCSLLCLWPSQRTSVEYKSIITRATTFFVVIAISMPTVPRQS